MRVCYNINTSNTKAQTKHELKKREAQQARKDKFKKFVSDAEHTFELGAKYKKFHELKAYRKLFVNGIDRFRKKYGELYEGAWYFSPFPILTHSRFIANFFNFLARIGSEESLNVLTEFTEKFMQNFFIKMANGEYVSIVYQSVILSAILKGLLSSSAPRFNKSLSLKLINNSIHTSATPDTHFEKDRFGLNSRSVVQILRSILHYHIFDDEILVFLKDCRLVLTEIDMYSEIYHSQILITRFFLKWLKIKDDYDFISDVNANLKLYSIQSFTEKFKPIDGNHSFFYDASIQYFLSIAEFVLLIKILNIQNISPIKEIQIDEIFIFLHDQINNFNKVLDKNSPTFLTLKVSEYRESLKKLQQVNLNFKVNTDLINFIKSNIIFFYSQKPKSNSLSKTLESHLSQISNISLEIGAGTGDYIACQIDQTICSIVLNELRIDRCFQIFKNIAFNLSISRDLKSFEIIVIAGGSIDYIIHDKFIDKTPIKFNKIYSNFPEPAAFHESFIGEGEHVFQEHFLNILFKILSGKFNIISDNEKYISDLKEKIEKISNVKKLELLNFENSSSSSFFDRFWTKTKRFSLSCESYCGE